MGPLGSFLFSLGVFLALIGVVLASNSPFMKEIFEQSEFLQQHRRALGTALALAGLALLVIGIGSGA